MNKRKQNEIDLEQLTKTEGSIKFFIFIVMVGFFMMCIAIAVGMRA